MIRLCLAKAGAGKSYWLLQQGGCYVACTHKSHRAVLIAVAENLGLDVSSRASIDDLIAIIKSAPKAKIALDDIDRTGPKICFSILSLAERHEIIATATNKKRCVPLLERGVVHLERLPSVNLGEIIRRQYPDLSDRERLRIAALADTPAVALGMAEAVACGRDFPDQLKINIWPVVVIAILAIAYFLRWSDLPEYWVAVIAAVMVFLRRVLWQVVR